MLRFTQVTSIAAALSCAAIASAGFPGPIESFNFEDSTGDITAPASLSTNTPSGSGFSIDFATDADGYGFVTSPDNDALDGIGGLTLTTWLNVREYTGGNDRLVSKQTDGNFGGFSWNMNTTVPDGETVSAGNFATALFLGNNLGFGADQFSANISDTLGADNEWVFLAVTWDGASGDVAFYLGDTTTAVVQLGATQSSGVSTIEGAGSRVGIGLTDGAPGSDTSVDGLQDDVRIYDLALADSALDAIRLEGLTVIPEPASLGLLALGGLVLRRRR